MSAASVYSGPRLRPHAHQKFAVQKILASPYKGHIINHELGSGKCVHPDTLIHTLEHGTIPIRQLDTSKNSPTWIELGDTCHVRSRDSLLKQCFFKAAYLYRQEICEELLTIQTASSTVTVTKLHAFYRQGTWVKSEYLCVGDTLCVNGNSEKILSISSEKYDGVVYDLSMDVLEADTQYEANGFLTHNTCTVILIADEMLKRGIVDNVYFLSPGSLRQNFIDTYKGKCGKSEEYFNRYRFLSYNYNNVMSQAPKNFNKCLVIVEESHDFISGKRNEGLQKAKLFDLINMSKDCKVLLVSGTPIFYPIDAAFYIQLCKPTAGVNYTDEPKFLENIKQPNYLARMFNGIISYFPGIKTKEDFPEIREVKDIHVPMSDYQYSEYFKQYQKEITLLSTLMGESRKVRNIQKPTGQYWLTQQLISRSLSNCVYPSEIQDILRKAKYKGNEKVADVVQRNDLDHKLVFEAGTVFLKGMSEYSRKILLIVQFILSHQENKQIVYSMFKNCYGVNLIGAILEKCGMKVGYFTGDLANDKKRQELVDNANTGKITVLCLTKAGAKGIDLKAFNYAHLVEPSGHELEDVQVMGRIARFGSHRDLPPELQFVQIYRYFSVSPSDEPCVDDIFRKKGIAKYSLIASIVSQMQNASFEKLGTPLNYEETIQAYDADRKAKIRIVVDDEEENANAENAKRSSSVKRSVGIIDIDE